MSCILFGSVGGLLLWFVSVLEMIESPFNKLANVKLTYKNDSYICVFMLGCRR